MKIIITNKQYKTLVENITNKPDIDEGVGELIRSTIGRFSRKKSLSKNPIDVEVRNVFTRDLDADIMKRDKQFPNNKSDVEFTNSLLRIKAIYEKIRLCAYLEPSDPEYLSVDDANWAIDTLIKYIYQIYDKNLKSIYKSGRGKKLFELVNSMKWVKETEIPVHKLKSKPKSVPRGTSKKSTPPKQSKPVPATPPQPVQNNSISKNDMMWYRNQKVIVVTPYIDKEHSVVRYDGENIQFPVNNKELVPI